MKDELHLNKALKELQDYRAIGSVEDLKFLKKLNTPKKVSIKIKPVYETKSYHCPNCEAPVNWAENCACCCQKIDWVDRSE